MHHGSVTPEIAAGLLALRARIDAVKIPPSKLDETINIAFWNIREFGKARRTEAELKLLADWIDTRFASKFVEDHDLIVMGDFNTPKLIDKLFAALASRGIRPLDLLQNPSPAPRRARFEKRPLFTFSESLTWSRRGKSACRMFAGCFIIPTWRLEISTGHSHHSPLLLSDYAPHGDLPSPRKVVLRLPHA